MKKFLVVLCLILCLAKVIDVSSNYSNTKFDYRPRPITFSFRSVTDFSKRPEYNGVLPAAIDIEDGDATDVVFVRGWVLPGGGVVEFYSSGSALENQSIFRLPLERPDVLAVQPSDTTRLYSGVDFSLSRLDIGNLSCVVWTNEIQQKLLWSSPTSGC